MAEVKIFLSYDEHRLNAMDLNLIAQDRDLTQELCQTLDRLYEQVVPEAERKSVEAFIEEERCQEAGDGFAVYHFHDADGDVHFMDGLHNNFYSAAYWYKNMQQEDENALSTGSLAKLCSRGYEMLDGKKFSELCEGISDDGHIAALVEFDMENGTVGICDNREKEWELYRLEDVMAALDRSERKSDISLEARREIFEEALFGKEIDLWEETDVERETDAPTLQM